jgi:hypothetical protein
MVFSEYKSGFAKGQSLMKADKGSEKARRLLQTARFNEYSLQV